MVVPIGYIGLTGMSPLGCELVGWRFLVKVGDLVEFNEYLGLIVEANKWITLVEWLDDNTVEDAKNYSELKVISEGR
tara:strand:- start:428 stop:658 length:231 start_codon:yes stop_codon:yes gene_type:complete